MIVLAIDTSAHVCSVSLWDSKLNSARGSISKDVGKGHAELLVPMIGECLNASSTAYRDIGKIAVVSGPGSFAGLRVGIATARGLAISLSIPVVGVNTLTAIAGSARERGYNGNLLTVIPARSNEFYYRADTGAAEERMDCGLADAEKLVELASQHDFAVCGAGSAVLNRLLALPLTEIHDFAAPEIETVARLGSLVPADGEPVEPVYFRPPDVKAQTGFALPRA